WSQTERERASGDVEVAPVLVRAHIAAGQLDEAEKALEVSLRRRPDMPELKLAQAQVHLSRNRVEPAFAQLGQLAERRPNDPEVQALLGEAARRLRTEDGLVEAQRAFDKALELAPGHVTALTGL